MVTCPKFDFAERLISQRSEAGTAAHQAQRVMPVRPQHRSLVATDVTQASSALDVAYQPHTSCQRRMGQPGRASDPRGSSLGIAADRNLIHIPHPSRTRIRRIPR
eukprot:464501-Rhodomonas_salina.2